MCRGPEESRIRTVVDRDSERQRVGETQRDTERARKVKPHTHVRACTHTHTQAASPELPAQVRKSEKQVH